MLDPTLPTVSRDDAEALVSIMRTANNSKGGVVLRYGDAARAILAAGFRRPSVSGDNAEQANADSLADFIESWYDRRVDPDHSWMASDLAGDIVEWRASQPREVEVTDAKMAELEALARDHYESAERSFDHVQILRDRIARVREWVGEHQEHEVYEADSIQPEECTDQCIWCPVVAILEETEFPVAGLGGGEHE